MLKAFRRPWLPGAISAVLLDLPFPLAGPLPPWRGAIAWIALAPLLWGILNDRNDRSDRRRHYLWRSALSAYLCGVAWYLLNCYWIYATMHIYGGIGPIASCGILLLFSLVLGLYFGVFGLLIALTRTASRSIVLPLLLAPAFWVALEFAASRITSVPWDQLGYSQVDNSLLTRLAPVTGVYGISFVLIAGNALFSAALLARSSKTRIRIGVAALLFASILQLGTWWTPAPAPTSASAVLVQPNLNVTGGNDWFAEDWNQHTSELLKLSHQTCTSFFPGIPERGPAEVFPECATPVVPDLIAWPESPAPFSEQDARFLALVGRLAQTEHSSVVSGNIAYEQHGAASDMYNSAVFISPEGKLLGRYDKIHLVPFGEYVPYQNLFFFAGTLTKGVSNFSRGRLRQVFDSGGHAFGIFICYESVFADEVRQFARNGAEVFVNISDDGWYGDTSAPWQHLNMARMRAIENRRWILRDTNSGVTAAIDPHGRVTQSAPRHVLTSLAVRYGYRQDRTFYTRYGDVFAIACVIIALTAIVRILSVAQSGNAAQNK